MTGPLLECFGLACDHSIAPPRQVTWVHPLLLRIRVGPFHAEMLSNWTLFYPELNMLDQFSQVHLLCCLASLILPVYLVFKYVMLVPDTGGLLCYVSSYSPDILAVE